MKRLILCIAAIVSSHPGCRRDGQPQHQDDHGPHAHGEDDKAGAHDHAGHTEGDSHNDGHGHDEVITLTPQAVLSAGIQLGEARRKSLAGALSASARLSLTQKGMARVAARVPGRVASIEVQLGQKVAKNHVLAFLESPELGRTRATFLAASMQAKVAEANVKREKDLTGKGISPERELREAESTLVAAQAEMNAAEAELHALGLSEADIQALKADEHYSSRFPVRSPIDGTVLEIGASMGEAVEGTTPLFMVGSLTELWGLIDIFETQLPLIHAGQEVELTVAAVPGATFRGRVDYIGDLVDAKSRTISVRVVVPNPHAKLKPGMFATARLVTGAQPQEGAVSGPVVVPREAVQKVGAEQVVFVPAGDNQFKPTEVAVGAITADEAEITSGLQGGERIVTKGAFILKSELSKESMGEGHAH